LNEKAGGNNDEEEKEQAEGEEGKE